MNSKLGFHIQKRRPGWPDVVADTVPALVKTLEWALVDEWGAEEQTELLKRERAAKWGQFATFLLGRQVLADQYLDPPAQRADEFWRRLLERLTGGDPRRVPATLARMRLFD
ncbi:MAG: hypothetical protein V1772_14210, partial [Chloroflexota bacterium]